MAKHLHNGPCPKCGSRDNLASYDDGSKWCWGCHYYEPSDTSPFVRERDEQTAKETTERSLQEEESVRLPKDAGKDYSPELVEWAGGAGIHVSELLRYGVLWSNSTRQCIFPFYDERGNCTTYNARNFDFKSSGKGKTRKSKYITQGEKDSGLHVYGLEQGERGKNLCKTTLVITEDCLSAIKVARQVDAMPALGTYVSVKKLQMISLKYNTLVVWLDSDKFKEAQHIAENAKWLGMSARAIYTDLDPKYYSDEEIKGYLT